MEIIIWLVIFFPLLYLGNKLRNHHICFLCHQMKVKESLDDLQDISEVLKGTEAIRKELENFNQTVLWLNIIEKRIRTLEKNNITPSELSKLDKKIKELQEKY